ncbi:MAG: hypothetical protein K8F52_11790 [Candidatus Scalindua rubra]|nr:hypothetical protein [Candidatus Scalindua rubra]
MYKSCVYVVDLPPPLVVIITNRPDTLTAKHLQYGVRIDGQIPSIKWIVIIKFE